MIILPIRPPPAGLVCPKSPIFYSSKSHNHRPTYPSCGYLAAEDAHLHCHTHSPITTAEKRGPTQVGFSGVAAPLISIIQSAPIVSQAVQSSMGMC